MPTMWGGYNCRSYLQDLHLQACHWMGPTLIKFLLFGFLLSMNFAGEWDIRWPPPSTATTPTQGATAMTILTAVTITTAISSTTTPWTATATTSWQHQYQRQRAHHLLTSWKRNCFVPIQMSLKCREKFVLFSSYRWRMNESTTHADCLEWNMIMTSWVWILDNLYLDCALSILVMAPSQCCSVKQTYQPAIHQCLNLLCK